MRNRNNYNEDLDEELDDELDEYDDYDDDDDDDDEDDSVADKLKRLKGKLDGVALFFLIIGGIGLISIICSFFVGGGFGFGGKPVPEDIYGTYYAVSDYEYYTFYIDEDGASSISNRGFDNGEEPIVYIKTEYLDADKAQSKFPNPIYEGCDAIVLYEDYNYGAVLWIVETEPEYKLVLNANGAELTNEPYNFKAEMGDYSNYYGTYTYDSNNSVEFFEDGTAEFKFNGETTTYNYVFVNKGWHEEWIDKTISTNGALLLYDEYNNTQTFEFISKTKISYGGQYTFTGTGSPDIEPEVTPVEPDNGGGDLGGGDIGGGDLGGGDLGGGDIGGGVTDETPDWETLLDFSNVSFSLKVGEDATGSATYELSYDEINDRYWLIMEEMYSGYTVTYQYYYSPSFGGYYMDSFGDESYVSKSDVLDGCNMIYSYIDDIDASSFEKVGENVWGNSSYKITLGSDGEVAKIERPSGYGDTLVFNIFDRGTTEVPAYCPF